MFFQMPHQKNSRRSEAAKRHFAAHEKKVPSQKVPEESLNNCLNVFLNQSLNQSSEYTTSSNPTDVEPASSVVYGSFQGNRQF